MEEAVSIGVSVHKVKLLEFQIAEAEAVISSADILKNWFESEQGKWIIRHAVETPCWHSYDNPYNLSTHFVVTAKLYGRDYTFWTMKWGLHPNN